MTLARSPPAEVLLLRLRHVAVELRLATPLTPAAVRPASVITDTPHHRPFRSSDEPSNDYRLELAEQRYKV